MAKDTTDYSFPHKTATNNIMTNPFDEIELPSELPQNQWIEGQISVLKLVVKDSNVHFSLKIKPDDTSLIEFDTYLGYVKDGKPHGMMRNSAATVAALIGGKVEGGKLRTREGDASQTAISTACDGALRAPVRFKVETKGQYTNLKAIELLS